ncbi:MAG: tellurite resistance TerB family protein [Desulfatiglans sp.]|nr:tellurite resistance TerB family protein [Desulfatiglans sp.]
MTLNREQEAVLLIRAMIASAASDKYIDKKERKLY